MKEYRNYSVEDFVWDDAFRRWVLQAGAEDSIFWEHWLAENPDRENTIRQARTLVLAIAPVQEEMPEGEKEIAIGRIMAHFDEQRGAETRIVPMFPVWAKAAGFFVLLLAFGWLFLRYNAKKTLNYDHLVAASGLTLKEVVNNGAKPKEVTLADGSLVRLDPGSKVSFPDHFSGGKREVYLSGSAFFDIIRNPSKPFYVYADAVVTKVLGTSFTVRSFNNEPEVSVAVKSGRVAVFTRTEASPELPATERSAVVIEPNQQLLVARQSVKMTKTLVPDPVPVTPANQSLHFNFSDTPVSEIFKTLQNAYGIEIIYDEKTMKDCPVTAGLTDLSLYEKLDLICNAVGAGYEIIDGRIIVAGGGCQEHN